MFDRVKAKQKAKTLVRTRSLADGVGFAAILTALSSFGIGIFIAAYFTIIPITAIAASGMGGMGATIAGLSSGLMLAMIGIGSVTVFFNLLFNAGMNRAALRMNRGDQNVRVVDIILAGDMLGKYICISLWQALYLFLWTLPSAAAVLIGLLILGSAPSQATVAIFAILYIAAVAWGIYIMINKSCQYYFAYCVAEDNRALTAHECIAESSSLMVDHKWELFVTHLSFLGWDMAASTVIGNVFVSPYKYLTYTSIYEQLTGTFRPVGEAQMLWHHNGPAQSGQRGAHPEHGAPAGERQIEILAGDYAGSAFSIKAGEEIAIGRDPQRANLVTSKAVTAISGLHCRIRYDGETGKYIIFDHSTNGTYLNNEKLQSERGTYAPVGASVRLADGAMIIRLS
ncbi:MAG: DUF975 family protein [Ruminococcaceae bacterium]|nr:DUF975 family protein [Oscillospiraceae bacterium]